MMNQQMIENNVLQGIAAYVDYLNNLGLADLVANLEKILTAETDKLAELASRQTKALSNIDWANLEIKNVIESNRGGKTGVHGFIAEFAETGITNARRAWDGLNRSTYILNDNGAADLLVHGKEVQVKFYENLTNELRTASNYQNMKMMFPKDHMEVFQKIMNGEKEVEFRGNPLSLNQIENIKKLINEESSLRGESWTKWMKSSALDYKSVQRGTIDQTLSNADDEINEKANAQRQEIKEQAKNDRNIANKNSQANFGEATKAAGIGATVQGGFNLGIFIYKKHKAGKEIWEFTKEDWVDGGITTLNGVAKGGITGYAIYGLTNVCHLAAPSAGAIASGTFGLANAIITLRNGEIDDDGFIDLVTMNAIDATGAAIGAAIGQVLIPVPVVGALVGSIVVTTALTLGKGMLNEREIEILNRYKKRMAEFITSLDIEYKRKLDELLVKYHQLGELQEYAFDLDLNVQLQFVASIELARYAEVDELRILHNESEIDEFFLS